MVLAVVPAAAAATARDRTVVGPVSSVGIAGTEVGYADRYRRSCHEVRRWDVATRGDVRVASHCFVSTSTGSGIAAVSVAGGRVLWLTYIGGNTREWSLWTKRGTARAKRIEFKAADVDGPAPIVLGHAWDDALPYAVGRKIVVLSPNGSRKFSLDAPEAVSTLSANSRGYAAVLADGSVLAISPTGRILGQTPFDAGDAQSAVLAAPGLIVETVDGLEIHRGTAVVADPAPGRRALPRLLARHRRVRDGQAAAAAADRERQRRPLPHARATLRGPTGATRPRVCVRPHARLHRLGEPQRLQLARAASPRRGRGRRRAGGRGSRGRPRRARARPPRDPGTPEPRCAWPRPPRCSRCGGRPRRGTAAGPRPRPLPRAADSAPAGTSSSTSRVPSGSAVKWTSSPGSSARTLATVSHCRGRWTPWIATSPSGDGLPNASGGLPRKPSARPWINPAAREGGRSGAPMSSPACSASCSWSGRLRRKNAQPGR